MELEKVSLAIVGGGAGSRMGLPKAWLRFGNESIVAWQLKRLQWPGPTMLITTPSTANPPDADLFDRQFIDPVDSGGPLQGVLTAVENSTTPLVVAMAIDMPLVDRHSLTWMAESLTAHASCLGVMCRRKNNADNLDAGSFGTDDFIEPFPSAFRVSAAPAIAELLQQGRRSMHKLCKYPSFLALDPPTDWPADLWTNLNEPSQLKAYEGTLNLQRTGTHR